MSVNITIDWHFVGQDEDAHVLYQSSGFSKEDGHVEDANDYEPLHRDTVLPLRTSVLAPGLSMPVPAR